MISEHYNGLLHKYIVGGWCLAMQPIISFGIVIFWYSASRHYIFRLSSYVVFKAKKIKSDFFKVFPKISPLFVLKDSDHLSTNSWIKGTQGAGVMLCIHLPHKFHVCGE